MGMTSIKNLVLAKKLLEAADSISGTFVTSAPKKSKSNFETIIHRNGMDITLLAFNGTDPEHMRLLGMLEWAVAGFTEKLPKVLKRSARLPKLYVAFKDIGAKYFDYGSYSAKELATNYAEYVSATRSIIVNVFSIKGPKTLMRGLFHEYGHDVFQHYMKYEAQASWTKLLLEDASTEDALLSIKEMWPEGVKTVNEAYDSLKGDPHTHEIRNFLRQLEVIINNRPDLSKASLEELLKALKGNKIKDLDPEWNASKTPFRGIPAHPTTLYGYKNPQEAFCEAFALFCRQGPLAVHPRIRRWMVDVLPSAQISTSSLVTAEEVEAPKDIWEALDLADDGYLSPEELVKLHEDLKKFPVLKVDLINKTYGNLHLVSIGKDFKIVDNDGDDYFKVWDPADWISTSSEADTVRDLIGDIISDTFNSDFQESPVNLHHATDASNIEEIMSEGLRAEKRTRGLTNRGTGAAIFTTTLEAAQYGSYGDTVLEIDVKGMKRDGLEYYVALEPSVVEHEAAGVLANVLGLDDYEHYIESDGADDPDTVVLFIPVVPPKYLKVID